MAYLLRVQTELTGWPGGPGLMTFYYETPTQDTPAVVRCRQYVHDLIGGVLASVMSNAVTWNVKDDVDVITAETGAVVGTFADSSAHTNTGGGGAGLAPIATACLVRWNTATYHAGRRTQGRTYVSPVASAQINADGILNPTTRESRNDAMITYLAAMDAGDSQRVWHRPKAGAGGSSDLIISGVFQGKLAVLTSRRD